jgi:hypothetical protein
MTTENTNGTENKPKRANLFKDLLAAFKKAPQTLSAKDIESLKKQWLAASKAKEAASKALADAQKAESAVVEKMVRGAGYRAWEFDGVRYLPSGQGQTCFLRREGFTSEAAL